MCGLSLHGSQAIPFLESLVVADVAALKDGTGSLTVFTNEKGGAIDDSVVTKVTDTHIYLVVNAGCRDKDLAHIGAHMEAFQKKGGDVKWHIHDERSLLALQVSHNAFLLASSSYKLRSFQLLLIVRLIEIDEMDSIV
jgi:aminomethyltransferase